MKLFAGSSALMRTSIEWPRISMSLWAKDNLSPARHPDHLGHKINTGDTLADWVLDLDPGIHFNEVEIPGFFVIEELNSTGSAVLYSRSERDGRFTKLAPRFLGKRYRGRFLPKPFVCDVARNIHVQNNGRNSHRHRVSEPQYDVPR